MHNTTSSSSDDNRIDSIKSSNKELQEQELEALRSIYADEFSQQQHASDSYQIAIHLLLHHHDDEEEDNNNWNNNDGNRILYLQFTYHDRYPSHEPPYFNFETKNWKLSGDDVATLHRYLVDPKTEEEEDLALSCYFTPGECCVFQWIEHLRDNIGEMLSRCLQVKNHYSCKAQEQQRRQVERDQKVIIHLETVGFYFHHIYNAEKKRLIVQHAKNLSLTGLYRYGRPGRVIVEGLQDDVRAYVQQIKRLRWQQCIVRVSNTKEISCGDSDNLKTVVDAERTFSAFVECSDDAEILAHMREHGCEDLFYDVTGLKPRRM